MSDPECLGGLDNWTVDGITLTVVAFEGSIVHLDYMDEMGLQYSAQELSIYTVICH